MQLHCTVFLLMHFMVSALIIFLNRFILIVFSFFVCRK